jgi:hypothetical protein
MPPGLRPTLRVLAATAMTLALALGPAVRAQDVTPEPALGSFCALLTADEASTALGVAVTPSGGSALDCDWAADESTGDFTTLIVGAGPGTIAETKVAYPGGKDLDIGGNTAYSSPEGVDPNLWMEVGGHFLDFNLTGYHTGEEGIDVQAVLTALATIAAGRIGSMSIPALGDQGLADLFPDEVGGIAVEVTSLSGQQMLANSSGPEGQATVKQITDALTSLGKTIDDVGVGYAMVVDSATGAYAVIVALQVRGADATALEPFVKPLFMSEFLDSVADPQETPTQVAGKDVIMVTDGPPSDTGNKAYIYPKNDVVWLVVAVGTGMTSEDVLGTLP